MTEAQPIDAQSQFANNNQPGLLTQFYNPIDVKNGSGVN
jgi:hypothetical protein